MEGVRVLVVEVIVMAAVLLGVAAVAAGRGGSLEDAPPDAPDLGIPDDRPISSTDVPRLRFRLALRGYRMSDVDDAVERLRTSLAALEAKVAMGVEPMRPAEPPHPEEPSKPEEPSHPEKPARPLEPVVPPVQPGPRPQPPRD